MSWSERTANQQTDTEEMLPVEPAAPGELLDLLWGTMTDILGTAATATLMRRAIRKAAAGEPALDGVTVGRVGYDYQYALPERWQEQGNESALRCLRLVIVELRVLLIEMTGPVVIRRLERVPHLRQLGMTVREER